jgi:hypothetical protein
MGAMAWMVGVMVCAVCISVAHGASLAAEARSFHLSDSEIVVRMENMRSVHATTNSVRHTVRVTMPETGTIVAYVGLGQDELIIRAEDGSTITGANLDTSGARMALLKASAIVRDHAVAARLDVDTPGALGATVVRLLGVLSEWPDTLPINYEFDMEAELARQAARDQYDAENPLPDDAPAVPGVETESGKGGGGAKGGRSLLAYTSLCSYVNNGWYTVTHDDWWYNRGNDRTTYYAWLSMHSSGPCSDGTYFWTGSSWACYEPDHDPNVEYAYGDCFGRCGGGCGSGTQFTRDCADHDSCVRFGHSLASLWCDDEFSYTVDDALWAPNCY